jgi:hypothetical protein
LIAAAALTAATAEAALAQNNPPPGPGTAPPGGATVTRPAPAPATPPAALPMSAPTLQPALPPAASLALPPQPPPPLSPSPDGEKRGFLNDVGKWWDKSVSDFNAKMKDQQTKLDEYNKQQKAAAKDAAAATNEAMKNAADAMVWLPTSKMIETQETCAIAGNGAADCQAAATKACMSKGFKTGQPLDVRTAEKCNASLWVSGQNPATAECPVETVVLRAACQ